MSVTVIVLYSAGNVTIAGFTSPTASAAVNVATPSGWFVVVTPVTSSFSFAPMEASVFRSPTIVYSFFPSFSFWSRAIVYTPLSSVIVVSIGVAPLYESALPANSFRERGSTTFSFSAILNLMDVRWSAFSTPLALTYSPAIFTSVVISGFFTLPYCDPASVTLMFSSFTHFTFATHPSALNE